MKKVFKKIGVLVMIITMLTMAVTSTTYANVRVDDPPPGTPPPPPPPPPDK